MISLKNIKEILSIINSKIEAHNQFKKAYNKQLAFDFNALNFFNICENKVSEILAFFLDENETHGQGNVFLIEFLKQFYTINIDYSNAKIICEKVLPNNKRIDLYIEFKNEIIAIENKFWAKDQFNQLKDYSDYLDNKTNGNYLLLYINPYGYSPRPVSIDKKSKEDLISKNQFKIISYKNELLKLIDKWLTICEAENVSYFLKQFKQYLRTKFVGNKILNMTENIKEIIYSNQAEIQVLIEAYTDIENEVYKRLKKISKDLSKRDDFDDINDIELKKEGPFNYEGRRVYKFGLSKGQNIIWIQIFKKGIDLFSSHYLESETDAKFKEITKNLEINNWIKLDRNLKNYEIIEIFIGQVRLAIKLFSEYENYSKGII